MEYFVTGNLNHDGREYNRGDVIDLADNSKAEAHLLATGVITTEPEIANAVVPAPEATPEPQPEVSGKPLETGEPSIDGRAPERSGDNATDVTPGGMRALSPDVRPDGDMSPVKGSDAPAEPTEAMTRAELEDIAAAEGISADDAVDAPNKAALIDLILENRTVKPADEPENDPSANL
jgi:hypothetical protein